MKINKMKKDSWASLLYQMATLHSGHKIKIKTKKIMIQTNNSRKMLK